MIDFTGFDPATVNAINAILPHLGPTPVNIDYYAGETGLSLAATAHALSTMNRIGAARMEVTAWGKLYGSKS